MQHCQPEIQPVLKGEIKIIVEKVHVKGNGVILLTGPSSCGKGEVANSLRRFLSIPEERHLSMGQILRDTIQKARTNEWFRATLKEKYSISEQISILDPNANRLEVIHKAQRYRQEIMETVANTEDFVSQLDWLEFCVVKGLLIPDEWTELIIEALFESSPELQHGITILDGYPRTVAAASSLLKTFSKFHIPVIKVLHLYITKEQMKLRALNRKRLDDTEDSLERRYQFYVEHVQPCIDYLKQCLGSTNVMLIDAHQPLYTEDGRLNLKASILEVTMSVMQALGLPGFLLDLE